MLDGGNANRVATEVAALDGLKIDELRAVWTERFGAPPALQSGDLMRRLLAELLQIEAFGDDPELARDLEARVKAYRRGKSPAGPSTSLPAGTRLTREHDGQLHHVERTDDGFVWRGQTWKSLSQIAREITGTRWNGPKFFGLREAGA